MFRFTTFVSAFLAASACSVHAAESHTGSVTSTPAASILSEISDREIEHAVAFQLEGDPLVQAENLNVTSEKGVVHLSGTVESVFAKTRARDRVRQIIGVRAIYNDLEVDTSDRSDAETADAVLKELAADPATDAYEIAVVCGQGVVTLQGEVDSHAERRLAEEVAGTVRGVREVVNHLSIADVPDRRDTEVRAEIERLLRFDPWIGDGVKVYVYHGQVRLMGTVGRASERARAYDLAWVRGVRSVIMRDLEVDPSTHQMPRRALVRMHDDEIADAVRAVLELDARVRRERITVDVGGGVVTLRGDVSNLAAAMVAAEAARHVIGVRDVENQIEVNYVQPLVDAVIETNVTQRLLRDPRIAVRDLVVDVRGRDVVLNGRVATPLERDVATDVASRVRGVTSVDNDIEVENPAVPRTDYEIREATRSALQRDPTITDDSIRVEVSSGVVILRGQVPRWQDALAATNRAYESGADAVYNQLLVRFE